MYRSCWRGNVCVNRKMRKCENAEWGKMKGNLFFECSQSLAAKEKFIWKNQRRRRRARNYNFSMKTFPDGKLRLLLAFPSAQQQPRERWGWARGWGELFLLKPDIYIYIWVYNLAKFSFFGLCPWQFSAPICNLIALCSIRYIVL